MSQILDALRRAEAQRSRGRVPGLHETVGQATLASGQPTAAPASRRLLLVVVGSTVIVAALVLGMLARSPDPTRGPAFRGDAPVAADARVEAAPAAAVPLENSPSIANSGVGNSQSVVGLPRTAQVPDSPNEPRAAPPRGAVAPPQASDTATDAPANAVPAGAALRAATAPVPARQDLLPEVQRSLPPITVSGLVYSSDPARRILMIDGELWHEGDQIRPGVVLEQIRRRDAVLRFNGLRFTVSP